MNSLPLEKQLCALEQAKKLTKIKPEDFKYAG